MRLLIKVEKYLLGNYFATLEAVGMELGVRNKEIINKLKENGVTYNFMIQKTN
jgi:hypothetical protein